MKTLRVTKDKAALGDTMIDESLVVNGKNRGVANVIVYLIPDDDKTLNVHRSYQRTADSKVELAIRDGRFEPHVLLLRTTQTMVQRNFDRIVG